MTSHAQLLSFLASCVADYILSHPGCSESEASFIILQSMTVITPDNVAMWEQDARILALRGQGLTATLIAFRLGICRSLVFKALGRHQGSRRATLRATG